jgi:hypothetical protein
MAGQSQDSFLLARRLDELCLLFRFEGVDPFGLSTLGARHGAHAPAAHGVPRSIGSANDGPAMDRQVATECAAPSVAL